LEVLESDDGYYLVTEAVCKDWVSTNSVSHPVLREKVDQGSIAKLMGMEVKEMLVVDRQLKIVFKGQVTDGFAQTKVLSTLSQLQ
jgi:hypothetical protein